MKTMVLFLSVIFVNIAFGGDNTDLITPKMKFAVAADLLKKYKAEFTMIQVAYPDEKKNRRYEHFILNDGRTIELSLMQKDQVSDWTIDAIFEVVWVSPGENREKKWIPLNELKLGEPTSSTIMPDASAPAKPHVYQEGSPTWIVDTFFTQTTFPTPDRYYTGEMQRFLENPPMGAYVPPGYSHQMDVLSDSGDSAVYRFTYSNTPKAGDWYAFLIREGQVWKLSAVRTLAIPMFSRELRDSLRAKANRDEKEESELQMMELAFSPDVELRAYLSDHIVVFRSIATRLLNGESTADLNIESAKVKVDHISITKEGWIQFIIGGVLDNTVGFVFVPVGKNPPKMSEADFILVDPVLNGWFLIKTT
ncbi:MAG: hypothetical protein SFY80_10300 [Verrucomicrobiota bacterium]|nr:hypothetical protein [Verrucomicrobiota bacterium]